MKDLWIQLIIKSLGLICVVGIILLLGALEWVDAAQDIGVRRGISIAIGVLTLIFGVYAEYLKILKQVAEAKWKELQLELERIKKA